jgi:hypothetical protein
MIRFILHACLWYVPSQVTGQAHTEVRPGTSTVMKESQDREVTPVLCMGLESQTHGTVSQQTCSLRAVAQEAPSFAHGHGWLGWGTATTTLPILSRLTATLTNPPSFHIRPVTYKRNYYTPA